jgi:hypothetical protein
MTAPGPEINVYTHYTSSLRKKRGIYMRKALINRVSEYKDKNIHIVRTILSIILNNPFGCGQQALNYIHGSSIYVLWKNGFYFLYRCHQPSSGPFAEHDYLVHVMDVGDFYIDDDGNPRLDIYEDPEALRTLAERDGEVIPDPRVES